MGKHKQRLESIVLGVFSNGLSAVILPLIFAVLPPLRDVIIGMLASVGIEVKNNVVLIFVIGFVVIAALRTIWSGLRWLKKWLFPTKPTLEFKFDPKLSASAMTVCDEHQIPIYTLYRLCLTNVGTKENSGNVDVKLIEMKPDPLNMLPITLGFMHVKDNQFPISLNANETVMVDFIEVRGFGDTTGKINYVIDFSYLTLGSKDRSVTRTTEWKAYEFVIEAKGDNVLPVRKTFELLLSRSSRIPYQLREKKDA